MALSGRQSRGNGAPQRRARKSPRAASSVHWPFLHRGTALLKEGRAKVRAQPFLPLALPGHQSRGNGAPQRRARKSPRAIFPSIGPSRPPVPEEAALLKGGRAKVRTQPLLSIGPFWPPVPGKRRSSKEGAQKSARSLFFPLALPRRQSRGKRLLKGGRAKVHAQPLLSIGPSWPPVLGERRSSKRARKSPRAASPFHWPFLATSPGGTALLKGGRAKVRARPLSFHWPFLAPNPGGTALLKGGRAKVRAQPLPSMGPSWSPVPGERRSSKEGAQKSARSLFCPLALPAPGNGAPQRRARKSPRATFPSVGSSWPPVPGERRSSNEGAQKSARNLSFHWPFLAASPGERRSSKEGAQKSARSLFHPLALPGHQSRGNGAPQRRARKSLRAASSIHWPFLATSPGGTALLKGGRAKVRAQPLLSIGPSWPPVLGERRSSKEGAQKSARSLSFPLALSGHQSRGNGAPQRGARKSPPATFPSIGPSWLPVPGEAALLKGGRAKVRAQPLPSMDPSWSPVSGERRSSKEGAQKSARSLFLPLALSGHQPRGNGAPQRRARKPRANFPSIDPFWPPAPGERRSLKEGTRKSARSLFFPLALPGRQSGRTALLKGGRAKVRAQSFLPLALRGRQSRKKRRSSKEGAQKSARSLFFPLALPGHQSRGSGAPQRRARKSPRAPSFLPLALPGPQSRGNGAPQRRARKSPRARSSFHCRLLTTSPGGNVSSKKGAQKSARSFFFPLALPGHQSRGNGAPQRRARKSPRAASSFHWPFLATSPGGTALLKGGRAKVRAQPLFPLALSGRQSRGKRRSSKESARFLGNASPAKGRHIPLALENALAAAAVFVDAPTTRRRTRKDVIYHWRLKPFARSAFSSSGQSSQGGPTATSPAQPSPAQPSPAQPSPAQPSPPDL